MKALRQERGWTQQELGAHLGASRQAIIAIENGRFDPSLPLALKVAKIFDKPVEQIFFLDD